MGRGAGKGGQRVPSPEVSSGIRRHTVLKGGKVSWDEVRKHRTPDDAWLVYREKVYDVSGWRDHPGGSVIFTHAGEDCTDIFAAFHPIGAHIHLEPFLIGEVDPSTDSKTTSQRDFEKAYRDLRGKLISLGCFKASMLYYCWKVLSNLLILAAAWALLAFSQTLAAQMTSAFLLALFWQQCGWLAHDFLHHQVFKNRILGDMAGILVGNVFQGFSVAWWKNKHNHHHAVPNLIESSPDAHDGDPDIDTMPILAWSVNMAAKAKDSASARFFIRNQALLYFPILLVARVSWLLQSFFFVFESLPVIDGWSTKGTAEARKAIPNIALEKAGLALHYLWYGALMALYMSPVRALVYFCASQMMCGFLLAIVFGLGHNGMEVYDADKRPDFWKLQVTTTRNVKGSWLVGWFCGGLHYQVDHHLFPMVPRHKLGQVHQLVESFCKEHGVRYHETTMAEGTAEVLQHLATVTTSFLQEFPAM